MSERPIFALRAITVRSAEPLSAAIPDAWALLRAAIDATEDHDSVFHGEEHWRGVVLAAIALIDVGAKADPAVLLAFCVLHDCQRHNEGRDPDHGRRAAALADRLHGTQLRLSDKQRELLRAALIDHDRGLTNTDPTIGACWDADRLTLPRLGITVDPARLSTPEGRRVAADPDSLIDPADTDWDWTLSRFYLASRGEWWTANWSLNAPLHTALIAFHGTGQQEWRAARRDGLLRVGRLRGGKHQIGDGRHIYVALSAEYASIFAWTRSRIGGGVVLRFRFAPGELVYGFEHGSFSDGHGAHPELLYPHDLPISRIDAVAAAGTVVDGPDRDRWFVPHDYAARIDDTLAYDDDLEDDLEGLARALQRRDDYQLACDAQAA